MKRINKVPTKVERVVEVVTEEREEIVEDKGGFEKLMGKRVLFHCMNFIYSGRLVGVNGAELELEDACVVFDTGPYTGKNKFKVSENVPNNVFIRTGTIEAYWEV